MSDQNAKDNTEDSKVQAQSERTERALAAIQAGCFEVLRTGPFRWTVKNGDKEPYIVSLQNDAWSCTCKDFELRGSEVRCKHIEGVRLSETAQLNRHKLENQMDPFTCSRPEDLSDLTDRVLWKLRQPLDMSRVKRRQAPGLGTVPYLEGYDVIDRANVIFDFAWSFDLLGGPEVVRWQKKVLIWNQQERRKVPALDSNGKEQLDEVGIVYVTGKVSVELKGRQYVHADLGRCIFTGDTPEALDMALAGAVTDCLKRCFRHLGDQFGNLLYDKEIAQNAGLDQSQGENTHASEQRTSGTHPSKPNRNYADGSSVNGNVSEQEAYDQYVAKLGKPPASRTDLRSWISANRAPVAA
jgi:hypothetical protein